jgi:hypothetical protein
MAALLIHGSALGSTLAQAQQDDCTGLKGADGAITECKPSPADQGKSDRPSPAVTGSLRAEKTDRGGARLLASELIGQTLHTSDGAAAGKVVDIVMASSLDGLSLVIRIGGIMGVGGRDIAIPAEQVAVAKDSSGLIRLTVGATAEQLQRAPVFDRTALMR